MVNATTLTNVKTRLGITDASKDGVLTALIAGVSKEIETFIGYELEAKARTETYDPKPIVFLRTIPVASVSSVKVSEDRDWTGTDPLTVADHYHLAENGLLYIEEEKLVEGDNTVQVVYTAGLGANEAAVETAAPSLVRAADMQVAEEFRRSAYVSHSSAPGPSGGGAGYFREHGLLERVKDLLLPFRRELAA